MYMHPEILRGRSGAYALSVCVASPNCLARQRVQNSGMDAQKDEIATVAARMVVEEGLEYGAAKRRAVKQMGLSVRAPLPDNDAIESAVQEYIALFCAESQAQELAALRTIALQWMVRLERFRPHLSGAVWHGTATQRNDIYIQLFCDDPKSAEIGLIDMGVRFEANATTGFNGESVDALSVNVRSPSLGTYIGVHLLIYDYDDMRGAMKPDSKGRRPRGDIAAVRALVNAQSE